MDKISEILGIEPIEVITPNGDSTVVIQDGQEEDVDYDFVRGNHYKLAMQAEEAMQIAMRIARESEQPRAIETLSAMLKTASEVNRQLLLLSKDKAETKTAKKIPQAPSSSGVNGQGVFQGTSKDINMLLEGRASKQ